MMCVDVRGARFSNENAGFEFVDQPKRVRMVLSLRIFLKAAIHKTSKSNR